MFEQKMQQQQKGLFSGPPSAPTPPPVVAPPVMPVQNSAMTQAAKNQQLAAMYQTSGRQSTMLTDQTDKLGG